jgi:hypothetical protein
MRHSAPTDHADTPRDASDHARRVARASSSSRSSTTRAGDVDDDARKETERERRGQGCGRQQ